MTLTKKSTKGWLYKALPDNDEMVNKKCCLSFNRDVKYKVDHILNSRENRKRGALKAKENKAGKKQQESWETSLSCSLRVRTFKEALIKNLPKEWKLIAASSGNMPRVTTVVSDLSVKCNAIFAVWIFAVVDLFSRVDTSHFQYRGTPC